MFSPRVQFVGDIRPDEVYEGAPCLDTTETCPFPAANIFEILASVQESGFFQRLYALHIFKEGILGRQIERWEHKAFGIACAMVGQSFPKRSLDHLSDKEIAAAVEKRFKKLLDKLSKIEKKRGYCPHEIQVRLEKKLFLRFEKELKSGLEILIELFVNDEVPCYFLRFWHPKFGNLWGNWRI